MKISIKRNVTSVRIDFCFLDVRAKEKMRLQLNLFTILQVSVIWLTSRANQQRKSFNAFNSTFTIRNYWHFFFASFSFSSISSIFLFRSHFASSFYIYFSIYLSLFSAWSIYRCHDNLKWWRKTPSNKSLNVTRLVNAFVEQTQR